MTSISPHWVIACSAQIAVLVTCGVLSARFLRLRQPQVRWACYEGVLLLCLCLPLLQMRPAAKTVMTGSQDEPRPPRFVPLSPDKPAPDFDAILATAEKAVPDARVTAIFMDRNPVRILMKHREDHTPAGRTNVLVDAYTGKVVSVLDWRTASPGFRLVKLWNRELHTGDIGGLPTRILASLISLSLPVMTITGPLIWWNRRRKLVPVTQSDQ